MNQGVPEHAETPKKHQTNSLHLECDPVAFPREPFREQKEALVSIVLLQDPAPPRCKIVPIMNTLNHIVHLRLKEKPLPNGMSRPPKDGRMSLGYLIPEV